MRQSCWGESWCCPGTRKDQDPKSRDKWLAAATQKGGPDWNVKLEDPADDPDLVWKTFEAPTGEPAASSGSLDTPALRSQADAPERYGGAKIPLHRIKEGNTWRVVHKAFEGDDFLNRASPENSEWSHRQRCSGTASAEDDEEAEKTSVPAKDAEQVPPHGRRPVGGTPVFAPRACTLV